jgi:branched-chain amino acid aminotransferase
MATDKPDKSKKSAKSAASDANAKAYANANANADKGQIIETGGQQSFKYCFFEDKVEEIEKAKVSIMTNALQYGTGVFGGIRAYYNEEEGSASIFRIEDHYERMLNSLKILGVEMKYSRDDLVDLTVDLAKRNAPKTDTYFRPFAYAKTLQLSPNLLRDKEFGFALYMIPLGDYLPTDKGLKVKVSSWTRIPDNVIPTRAKVSGGYINSALARRDTAVDGYDEAIFLNQNGTVAEGSAENIFIVRDGTLITTQKTDDILEGITRRSILKIADDLGIPTEERSVARTELYVADEAFFCGTGCQIAWLEEIDNRKIGGGQTGEPGKRGQITEKISKKFFNAVKGNSKKYADWCTKIS